MSPGPLDVILLWRRDQTNQPWSLDQIFYRNSAGAVAVHESSQPHYYHTGPASDFAYLWGRHLDGSGGDGYSYEIEGFTLTDLTELDGLLSERFRESDFFTDLVTRDVGDGPRAPKPGQEL
jgi:hypothetical protein